MTPVYIKRGDPSDSSTADPLNTPSLSYLRAHESDRQARRVTWCGRQTGRRRQVHMLLCATYVGGMQRLATSCVSCVSCVLKQPPHKLQHPPHTAR